MTPESIIGKTISKATRMKKPEYDDTGWLKLDFTDGTCCVIVSYYGGYTGLSEDEYPTYIGFRDESDDLVPVE